MLGCFQCHSNGIFEYFWSAHEAQTLSKCFFCRSIRWRIASLLLCHLLKNIWFHPNTWSIFVKHKQIQCRLALACESGNKMKTTKMEQNTADANCIGVSAIYLQLGRSLSVFITQFRTQPHRWGRTANLSHQTSAKKRIKNANEATTYEILFHCDHVDVWWWWCCCCCIRARFLLEKV